MSKVDKNDLIYFKECCDKTYATSKNVETDGLVQQTVNGNNVYPKTIAEAVIMPDGKTLEEFMQSGGGSSIIRASDATISGITSITSTGTYQFAISLSPSNYNVDIEKVTVTSDCSEITISNVSAAGFTMNVNSVPSATDHKLTVVVEDKLGVVVTKEVAFTVKVEPTAITISGSIEIDNETTNNYTIGYTPSNYNIAPTSVEITSNQASVVVGNKTNNGFTLTANCENDTTATITVKATMPSGNIITKTISINVSCGLGYNDIEEVGVAIMCLNGKIYPTAEEWRNAGRPTANGVAISDGTHRFCIAPYHVESACGVSGYSGTDYWGAYGTQVNGVQTETSSALAKQDFDGISNTDAIVAQVKSSDGYFTKEPWSAAGLCNDYIFPNGTRGYLGAVGEWSLVQGSIDKINTLLDAIGERIDANSSALPYYWSSTQFSSTNAWSWGFSNKDCSNDYKGSDCRVRAFSAF